MVWPDPTAKAGTPSDRQQHFLPRQPGIGRPRTRGVWAYVFIHLCS